MKTIKLKKMTVANFKGIANGTFDFNDNTEIIADVQQGKSTLKDAYLFALGLDVDNFYPLDKNNNYIDNLKTNVTLTIDADGLTYELSRSANIKYKVDKENNTKTFDGFKKDIFSFDQVPCTAGKYKDSVIELFGISDFSTFKVLTVLNLFNEQLSWKERRQLLYNLYVDKSVVEKISADPKYSLIANELAKGKSSADISAMINNESKKVKEEKIGNEALIAEYTSQLSTYESVDYSTLEKKLEKVKADIDAEKIAIEESSLASKVAKLRAEVSQLETDKYKLISDNNNQRLQLAQQEQTLSMQVQNVAAKGTRIENEVRSKSAEYNRIKAETFDNNALVCPTCHQPLPKDAADKIAEEWESNHSKALTTIVESIKSLRKTYQDYIKEYTEINQDYEIAKDALASFEKADTSEFDSKIEELNKEISKIENEPVDKSKLTALENEQLEIMKLMSVSESYNALSKKLEGLKAKQLELVQLEIDCAKKKKQLDEFTFETVSAINNSINSHFNGVSFKVFEQLTSTAKNDIKETLVVLNNGIDYGACSTGQKAETNMLIVSTLQSTLGVNLPIWVDDASITNFKQLPENQMIFLLNEKGKELNCSKIRDIY